MKRFLPKSLLGQVTLAVALTLFVVQGINAVVAWTIEKDRMETQLVNTLGLRLIASARVADFREGALAAEIGPELKDGATVNSVLYLQQRTIEPCATTMC